MVIPPTGRPVNGPLTGQAEAAVDPGERGSGTHAARDSVNEQPPATHVKPLTTPTSQLEKPAATSPGVRLQSGAKSVTYNPAPTYKSARLGMRVLRYRQRGPGVRELQTKLLVVHRLLGVDCSPTSADGKFLDITEAAVARFQAHCRLKVDGLAGQDTLTALDAMIEQLLERYGLPTDVLTGEGVFSLLDQLPADAASNEPGRDALSHPAPAGEAGDVAPKSTTAPGDVVETSKAAPADVVETSKAVPADVVEKAALGEPKDPSAAAKARDVPAGAETGVVDKAKAAVDVFDDALWWTLTKVGYLDYQYTGLGWLGPEAHIRLFAEVNPGSSESDWWWDSAGLEWDSSDSSTARESFKTEAEKDQKSVVWLRSGGELFVKREHVLDGHGDLAGDAKFSYCVVRPYTYPIGRPNSAALTRKVFENTVHLPMTLESIKEIEQGSYFEIKGKMEVDATGEISEGKSSTSGGLLVNVHLKVLRLADNKVKVEVKTDLDLEGSRELIKTKMTEDSDELLRKLSLRARIDHDATRIFTLDLDTDEGKDSFVDLTHFQSKKAKQLAGKPGVILDKEEINKGVAGDVEVTRDLDPTSKVSVSAGLEVRRSEQEKSHKGHGGLSFSDSRLGRDSEGDDERDAPVSLTVDATAGFADVDETSEESSKHTRSRDIGLDGSAGFPPDEEDAGKRGPATISASVKHSSNTAVTLPKGSEGTAIPTTNEAVVNLPRGSTASLDKKSSLALGATEQDGLGLDTKKYGGGIEVSRSREAYRYEADDSNKFVRSGSLGLKDLLFATGGVEVESTIEDSGESESAASTVNEERPKLEQTMSFSASSRVSYRFTAPVPDLKLPLSAEAAQKMPPKTKLELDGKVEGGVAGFRNLLADDPELKGSAGLTLSAELGLDLEWEAENNVKVTWELHRRAAHKRSLERKTTMPGKPKKGDKGGDEYAAEPEPLTATPRYDGQSSKGTKIKGTLHLDLSRDEDRRIYEALVKGNTKRAEAEAKPADLKIDPYWNNSDGVQVKNAPLLHWFKGGVQLFKENLDPESPDAFSDPSAPSVSDTLRDEYAKELKEQGKTLRWMRSLGAVDAEIGYTHETPVGTPFTSVRLGAWIGKHVKYAAIWPQVDGKEQIFKPAFTGEDALELLPGSEYVLEGEVSAGITAGVEAKIPYAIIGETPADSLTSMPLGVVAGGGAKAEGSTKDSTTIRVKKLRGSAIQVKVTKSSRLELLQEIWLKLGIDIDLEKLLASPENEEKLLRWAATLTNQDARIKELVAAEIKVFNASRKSHANDLTFVLDLDKREGREAFDILLQKPRWETAVDMGDLARKGTISGVRIASGETLDTYEANHGAELTVGGSRLFLLNALRRDTTKIERRHDDDKVMTKRTDKSEYERDYKGPFLRKADLHMEAVLVRTDEVPAGLGYTRLAYTNKDVFTSKREAEAVVKLAEMLQATPKAALRMEVDNSRNALAKLVGTAHGETLIEMEIFFTDAGLNKLARSSYDEAMRTCGQLWAEATGNEVPLWASADAKVASKARRLMEDWLAPGSEHSKIDHEAKRYYRRQHHNVEIEEAVYLQACKIASMVARLGETGDRVEWNKALADMARGMGFEFYYAPATLSRLAGHEEVVVHKLQMKSVRPEEKTGKLPVDIEMVDEGLLEVPSGQLEVPFADRRGAYSVSRRTVEEISALIESVNNSDLKGADKIANGDNRALEAALLSPVAKSALVSFYNSTYAGDVPDDARDQATRFNLARTALLSGCATPAEAVSQYSKAFRGVFGLTSTQRDRVARMALLSGFDAEEVALAVNKIRERRLDGVTSDQKVELATFAGLAAGDRVNIIRACSYYEYLCDDDGPLKDLGANERQQAALCAVMSDHDKDKAAKIYKSVRKTKLQKAEGAIAETRRQELAQVVLVSNRDAEDAVKVYNAVIGMDAIDGIEPGSKEHHRLAVLAAASGSGAEEAVAARGRLYEELEREGGDTSLAALGVLLEAQIGSRVLARLAALGLVSSESP